MKAVLMSIQPKWCELIAKGKKTVEVRKTKPKIETPFKVYIYATKQREYLHFRTKGSRCVAKPVGGKVIGEFVCEWIDTIECDSGSHLFYSLNGTCLTQNEILNYCNGQDLYGWHISDLVIYDKPKELGEFKSASNYARKLRTEFFGKDPCCVSDYKITRPPQSWCYVERSDNNGE